MQFIPQRSQGDGFWARFSLSAIFAHLLSCLLLSFSLTSLPDPLESSEGSPSQSLTQESPSGPRHPESLIYHKLLSRTLRWAGAVRNGCWEEDAGHR